MVLLLASPPSIEVGEVCSGLGGEIFGFDGASQRDGHPDLLEVASAVGTGPEVGLEFPAVPARQRAFEVVGDEFDCLLAHEVVSAKRQHRSALPHLGFEDLAQSATAAVQEDPLVADTNSQHVRCFGAGETLDIPQQYDLALPSRQVFNR